MLFGRREIRVKFEIPKKTKEAPATPQTAPVEEPPAPCRTNFDQAVRYVAVAAVAFIAIDTYRQIKIEEAGATKL